MAIHPGRFDWDADLFCGGGDGFHIFDHPAARAFLGYVGSTGGRRRLGRPRDVASTGIRSGISRNLRLLHAPGTHPAENASFMAIKSFSR